MEFRFLLDTNVVGDLVRRPQGKAASRIAQEGESRVCTSIVVAGELRFGAAKRGAKKLTTQLEAVAVLSALPVLPLQEPADRYYGELRSYLERRGKVIGPNDMLIAAHALALELTLVTANMKEFLRVPRLRVENWLA